MIQLGIVGSGLIVNEFLSELHNFSDIVNVVAITSRIESYEKNIKKYGDTGIIVCKDYDELLEMDEVDTVYVAVPNHLHFEYSIKALRSQKHVICEKPFTTTLLEATTLKDEAILQKKMIFEAVTTLYAANFLRITEIIEDGSIGAVKMVECNYTQYSRRYDEFKKGNILPVFDPKMYGGALMDINVYNLHFVIGVFGRPVNATYYPNIEQNIDTSGILILEYPEFKCVCIGAKDCHGKSHISIQGEEGMIYSDFPSNSVKQMSVFKKNQLVESNGEAKTNLKLEPEFRAISSFITHLDWNSFESKMEHSIHVMEILEKCRR